MRAMRSYFTAGLVAIALLLSGCSTSTDTDIPQQVQNTTQATAAGVTFEKMWVKATEENMTAIFGTLHNTTDTPIHVAGLSCDLAGRAELHETVNKDGQMMMQEMADGFDIPANGEKRLEPGADHLMLMELNEAIKPGQEITVTLKLGDGSEIEFTATAREFKGAKEEYGVHGEDEEHQHGEMDDDEKKDDGN
ncbi:MAG: copper chaperone PCu(A)C [Bowdeniella nasicola]|nr:copper chaperone PCu(A)C [Bowdeniella nasicola]